MSASAGRVLLIPKGDYDSSVTYNMLDMVFYGGKTYVCKQTSTGNAPTNTVYWQIMTDGAVLFNDLSDVDITNPQNGDGIAYNATTHKWENTSPVSIQITNPPTKTEYIAGENLDLTGIVVMAEYSTGTTRNITTECTFSPANGSTVDSGTNTVTVTWRTFSATQTIDVSAIYGVQWDGSASQSWTRTDASASFVDPVPQMSNGSGGWTTGSSPFDSIRPWSGMEIVEDASAGTLVKIPKYWYKWTRSGSSMKLQIANSAVEGFLVSPAHADRGDGQGERDYVYVGRYHCRGSSGSSYNSTTGVTPARNLTRSQFRTYIHNIGSDIWQWDFAMYWTIMMLYLVEFANWNTQNTIGYGCGNGSAVKTTGTTDNMTYHTGTDQSSRTSYGYIQYRHIEDLWANIYDYCDGIYFSSNSIYCIKNPASFSDSTGGVLVGTKASGGWITGYTEPTASGYEYALFPNAITQSNDGSSYVGDFCYSESSPAILFVGGNYGGVQERGGFYVGCRATSAKDTSTGSRLMKLPANT